MKNDTQKILKFQNKNAKDKPLWNMGNIEDVREFIRELEMCISNNQVLTAGLFLLLKEISGKPHLIDVVDYCDEVGRELFVWTVEAMEAKDKYVESLSRRAAKENLQ